MPRSAPPTAVSSTDALERLREGNRRFAAGDGNAFRQWHPGLVDGQWPFAVILGCSDSRAPAEYVFDQGLGDLFVIRVAGNIVAPSLVGSVEFAVGRFDTRLVVVMGHTQCGAVTATLRALASKDAPESTNIHSIVRRITPHLEKMGPIDGDEDARVAAAVRTNALASAAELRHSSPILESLVKEERVLIVAAVYDLATGVVNFLDDR